METLDFDKPFIEIKHCRTCKSINLSLVLDLGLHPLANNLLDAIEQEETYFPLTLIRCKDCTTLQLSVNVNPQLMFSNYLWVTGTTETARNHCRGLSIEIIKRSLVENPKVIEIGSNDGTLLKYLIKAGATEVVGIDPASNIQPRETSDLIHIFKGFFSHNFAKENKYSVGVADIVVARNVLSHVPDLNDVMQGIQELVRENGMIVIEFHEASKILTELHYDSIYHEHTFYHSLNSIKFALNIIGFNIFDVLPSPISGGSFIVFASRVNREPTPALLKAIVEEESSKVYSESAWRDFALKARENIETLREILKNDENSNWIAFGASARSSTLLNSIGPISKNLKAIVDNNNLKQGKYSPGLHLEIVAPEKIVNDSIQKIFICAFNFENEIIDFLRKDLQWHGEVLIPLPNSIRRFEV